MNQPLKNKVAIVTGGSRGIGRAVVMRLAKLGCDVAFNYQSNAAAAMELENELKPFGGRVQSSQVDIKDFDAVKEWIAAVQKEFGRVDILVNNAGIIRDKALMMMSREDWDDVIQTNLSGAFHAARACVFAMMKQKSGVIVNMSSVSGVIGLPGQTNYSAAKGGMNAFTKALAKEVAGHGVRVNAVAPGFIETDMISKFSDEQKQAVNKQIPLGRIGSVEDVAHCVEFLVSDASRYLTGQIIVVDGGLAMKS